MWLRHPLALLVSRSHFNAPGTVPGEELKHQQGMAEDEAFD
jgi:hypothetical protein